MKAFTGCKIAALCLVTAPVWAASGSTSHATTEKGQRYPYDPVCEWGRVADGHGMLMRCLTEQEATTLGVPPTKAPAEPAAEAPTKGSATSASETDDKGKAAPEQPTFSKADLTVEKVGPIVVDTGDLPLAVKKLSGPKDRYLECVKKNGGLSAEHGEVQVRFLVRERGRAEGVSVIKRKGLSEPAAKCIAEVVDRRYVGYPAAPIVGVTLPIAISVKK